MISLLLIKYFTRIKTCFNKLITGGYKMNTVVRDLLNKNGWYCKPLYDKYNKMYYDEFNDVMTKELSIKKAEKAAYKKVSKELNPKNKYYNPYLTKLLICIVPFIYTIVYNFYAFLGDRGAFIFPIYKYSTYLYLAIFILLLIFRKRVQVIDILISILWFGIFISLPVVWALSTRDLLGPAVFDAWMTKKDSLFITNVNFVWNRQYDNPDGIRTFTQQYFDYFTLLCLIFSPIIPLFIKKHFEIRRLRK